MSDWFSVCVNIASTAPSPYLKASSKKTMIQTELIDMSINFYYTKLYLSKCICSCVVTIKENIDFKFQLNSKFIFLVSHTDGLLKCCSSFEGSSGYKNVWSQVTWFKFCIQPRRLNAVALEWLKLLDDRKYDIRGHPQSRIVAVL
jgi:hypothetical protein